LITLICLMVVCMKLTTSGQAPAQTERLGQSFAWSA
jgi:hypothetical protein